MINIKQEIGRRIFEARKAKGLTRKVLAELTDDLKPSRINNWEHGIRTPGPEAIKQLAIALDLSPAFLMCLTDEKQPKKIPGLGALIPLLDHQQAQDPQTYIQMIKNQEDTNSIRFIPVNSELALCLGEYAFAIKVIDDSMAPEMRIDDIQIVEPSLSPNPSDYVVARINGIPNVVICQYKKLSYTSPEFELLTLNNNWPNINVHEGIQIEIVGKIVQNIRTYF